MDEVKTWLKGELATIRTGRASSALLDSVKVDFYGSHTPLNQTAAIISEDARTLKINPYDKTQTKNIEKALTDADLGVSVVVNDAGIRVIFPELTSERRDALLKQVGKRVEEARISVRKNRDETWNDIQEREKSGAISEDEKFRAKEEMQKIVDEAQKQFEEMSTLKEREIKS
ncbi:MAG TPA: ribosome recycling factor [Candidatus Paceibacterota bacterium]|nr:ribosome recycling factor [Candidatus Paceibacterota bacterium]HRZ34479.1 ribosome recycling factor [Candidatus Paceibacterota bacterium]